MAHANQNKAGQPKNGSRPDLQKPQNPLVALTPKQRQYAMFMAEGKSAQVASKLSGYRAETRDPAREYRKPAMQQAIQHLQRRYEASIVASRKMVLEGFLEAIEQAKLQADPAVQIAGWREIGKMCGYYAPEVKEVNVHVSAKRLVGQLEVMTDAALLELIEKDTQAIEGEAAEVLEAEPLHPLPEMEPLLVESEAEREAEQHEVNE